MKLVSNTQLQELANYSGDPWVPANHYFAHAELGFAPVWTNIVWPFIEGNDFSHVVDLAAGHGRNSEMLSKFAGRLTIMDIQPGNVEVCARRLAGRGNIQTFVINGYDMQPVVDGDVTFVYCFDAMVHFDSDVVRSYLRDTRGVLAPGGRGFFHHSNYTGGHDWRTNLGARNFMSKELFAHYALKEGLTVVDQRVIDWSGETNIDCLTLLERGAD